MSARGADDVHMGDEVAQRGVSDAESVGGDEVRETRRRNSPSDPTFREIEDHVLTGHATFRSWCAACVQGRGQADRHQGEGRKELEYGSKVPVVSWDYCFLGARNRISEVEVEQHGDSRVLALLDGVTTSIFAHLITEKGFDFPSNEKVVKTIVSDFDKLGYNRVVFRCDIEPSFLALLRAVKLAWTDVVQETSAEGDPQSNGAAESLVNVIKGHVRSIKLALESASWVEVPADHDLLTWLVPYAACTVGLQWVETARQRMNEMREGALFHLWHSSVNECGGCLCSHPTAVWALRIHDLNKEGTWDRWTDRTRCLLALQAGCRRPGQSNDCRQANDGLAACWTKHSAAN